MTVADAAAHDRVPKLTEYCFNSLVDFPVDKNNLYKLSTDELVEQAADGLPGCQKGAAPVEGLPVPRRPSTLG